MFILCFKLFLVGILFYIGFDLDNFGLSLRPPLWGSQALSGEPPKVIVLKHSIC